MRKSIQSCLIALLSMLSMLSLAARPHQATGVTLELVSEHDALVPGQTALIGLRLQMKENFHTYWRQPGIVGLAPSLQWTLPEGFSAGEMLWAAPKRVIMAEWGAWGHQGQVVHLIPLQVPATLDPVKTPQITLKAKATWMCCSRTCHPGSTELSLTLPVRKEPAPVKTAWSPFFDQTRSQQALPSTDWTFSARAEKSAVTLSFTPPLGIVIPEQVYFFSYARYVDSHQPHTLTREGDGRYRLHLPLTEMADTTLTELRGELYLPQPLEKPPVGQFLRVKTPIQP
jgi:DsbC/DsbD-like thiol-disulfide interchange protein